MAIRVSSMRPAVRTSRCGKATAVLALAACASAGEAQTTTSQACINATSFPTFNTCNTDTANGPTQAFLDRSMCNLEGRMRAMTDYGLFQQRVELIQRSGVLCVNRFGWSGSDVRDSLRVVGVSGSVQVQYTAFIASSTTWVGRSTLNILVNHNNVGERSLYNGQAGTSGTGVYSRSFSVEAGTRFPILLRARSSLTRLENRLNQWQDLRLSGRWIIRVVDGAGLPIPGARLVSDSGTAYHDQTPCGEADCDVSGDLTVFDFLCFQDAFVASDPYADCDRNNTFDVFDFVCFQDAFVAGCP